MIEDAHELLRKVEIFSSLASDELRAIASKCRERFFRKNQTLFFEGDPGGTLYIIVEGRVKVLLLDEQGHELILSVMGPGEVLGEISLFDGGARSATVSAVEDTTALTLRWEDVLALVRRNPSLAESLLAVVCSRLRRASRILWEVVFLDVETRLCSLLLDLARREGHREGAEIRLRLTMSRQELASMIGASREATTRALRELHDRGLIRLEGRCVYLTPVVQELTRAYHD